MKIGERIRVVKTCSLLDGCNFTKGDTGVITDIGFSTGDIIVKFRADRDNITYIADVDEIEVIKMREVENLYFYKGGKNTRDFNHGMNCHDIR